MIQISAVEFKEKCLKLIDLIEQKHETIVITKRGAPVAKLVPYEKSVKLFGFLKGSVTIKGNLVEPIDENCDVERT